MASRSQRGVSRVQIWQGGEPEWALCLQPPIQLPSPLCFEQNRAATFQFFHAVRGNFERGIEGKTPFIERRGTVPRIPGYYDLSKVTEISTACAVVLAAEYDRVATLHKVVPPTVDLHKWNDSVFAKLFQIGFFEITGHTPKDVNKLTKQASSLTMRIVRSTSADDLREIDLALQQLFVFLGAGGGDADATIIEFLTALSEAMTNVTNHAYTSGVTLPYRHIDSFWVAATADKEHNSITIVLYDQGATIPITYPRLSRLKQVLRFLSRALKADEAAGFQDDGTYIRAAMRYGGSRTDQRHRGRGLPQMFSTLQKIGKGTLTVYSRGGWCQRTSEGRMKSGAAENPIGGTLVEWSVVLP